MLASLAPEVKTVVFGRSMYEEEFKSVFQFIPDPEYLSYWSLLHRCNPFGTPFFKSMMERLEYGVDAEFYGYCNGDLLFHSSLLQVLRVILQKIHKDELKPQVCLLGDSDE